MKNDRIEDIYRLSPVQEGMLFHALQAMGEGGAYLQQFLYAFDGEVDAAAFARAFQEAVDRHPALRTAFLWERQGRPLQVVARRATLPVTREEWPAAAVATPEAERRALADLLERDRRRGFDLGKPPLLRLTLAQAGRTYLLWTYHHLVLDGWSMALVLREVLARCRALAGGPAFDREPPRPFRDYIVWLDRQDLAAAEAYWRHTLAGLEAATPLPAGDAVEEAAGVSHGGKRTVVLPEALRDALQARAQRAGLTLNTLAQGAWALFLARAAGLGEVVFGTVVSGRPAELPGVEEMVGMFINTLPVRVRIDSAQPLAAWLRDLQAAQLAMRRYEYSPLARVQAWSEVPPGHPLFESILVFENRALFGTAPPAAGATVASSGPRLRPVEFQGETGYPLTAAVEPGQGLALTLAWDRRRFDAVTVARWLGHLATLFTGLDGDLDRPVEALDLLSPGERHQILREWNDGRTPLEEDCLHRLFAAQAARTPDAVALEDAHAQLTYGELARRAHRLARHLRRLGVGPDRLAGILLPRSNERIVAVLAILAAGGAYLPLDPEQPAARLAVILEDARAGWLLTRRGLAGGLAVSGARIVDPAEEADAGTAAETPAETDAQPDGGATPDNLAYVIYTSGSTGRPKGVLMAHREIGATFAWRQTEYPLGPGDSVLQTTAFGFDATLWSIFAPLLHGARLVLSLPEGARGSAAVEDQALRHGITAMQLPPAWLRLFLEELAAEGLGALLLGACLRFVMCGGEALTGELQEQFFSRLDAGLHNLYGPTETALDASFWVCHRGDGRNRLPIGRPIANKELYVLGRLGCEMKPLPAGAPGELYIGGRGMARGYAGDPALTAERFVPHPWSGSPGARLYRSGDLARFQSDGNLEFLGRADQQVKVRGFRIELGEIEATLSRHPGLRQVAVVTREDPPGAPKRLVAYVVPREGSAPSTGDLRAFLEERLPDFMVPAAFVELERLPLKASGKLDRDSLPAPGSARPVLAHLFVAPRDEREERLAEVWKAVLGLDRVGAHDNFFELGGDSILSLQVVSRARQAGLHLTTRHVFEHQTLAELAAACGAAPVARAEQGAVAGEVPLTPIQHWFFDHVRTDRHHWNQAVLLAARRRPVPALLERAVGALLVHHDALRLRFESAPDGVRQRHAAPADGAPLHVVDLTALAGRPAGERTAALETAAAAAQTTLDLARGPLLRAVLFDLGPAEPARLLLAAHHLAVDGVSWRLLIEDLTSACEQAARGEAVRLPPKTTSFQHWAERLINHAQTPEMAAEAGFWLAALGTPPEPLPRDYPAGNNREADLRTVRVELSAEETRTLLREVPKSYNSRTEDLLLAAAALAFQEWTGRPSLLVDLEGHGREELFDDVDLSRTVGWFTAEYPVRLTLEEGGGEGEALRAVREALRRVPAKGIGFGLLRYLHAGAALRERLRALPRAEVVFNYLGQFDGTLRADAPWGPARESAGPPRSRRGERHSVFDLNGSVAGGRLLFDWGYSAGLHDRATVERLAHGFLAALRRLIAHCAAGELSAYAPSDFPLARTDQATLDRLSAAGYRLEDLYPLSPMQQGMLFDSLYGGEGVYVMQLACMLRGDLDEAAFGDAWQAVTRRHPVLRTAFVWEGCDQPLQMVLREVPPVLVRDDWRGLDEGEQEARFDRLVAERRRHFDLTRAPLVRLDLVRVADRAWRFLWSSHHLILDGWSNPMIFAELMALYEARRRGAPEPDLPERRPFRDYIAWLGGRDPAAAQRFFRRALAGYAGARPLEPLLVPPERRIPGGRYSEVRKLLPVERTAELQAFARRHRLTLSTLVQGAWALVLAHLTESRDVVFGATVAGRPAALAGVEAMVGMFINTLPVRLRIAPESPLAGWLREHQERQAEMAEHEDAPLARIQQWCALPDGASLFDSILVFENYPVPSGRGGDGGSGLEIGGFRYFIRESFPLILDVGPGAELSLRLKHDEGLYQTAALADTLADLEALLERFLAAPEAPLARFLDLLASRAEERRAARRQELREAREGSLLRAARRRVEVSGVGG